MNRVIEEEIVRQNSIFYSSHKYLLLLLLVSVDFLRQKIHMSLSHLQGEIVLRNVLFQKRLFPPLDLTNFSTVKL